MHVTSNFVNFVVLCMLCRFVDGLLKMLAAPGFLLLNS